MYGKYKKEIIFNVRQWAIIELESTSDSQPSDLMLTQTGHKTKIIFQKEISNTIIFSPIFDLLIANFS